MAQGLLGALDASTFLRRHWQRRPLFVRGAIPNCGDWLERDLLFEWAARDDVESRLVTCRRGRWAVQHGPFRFTQLRRLPARGWSLLIQGVEQIHPEGEALLKRFSFLPHARLDDLMVSYAPPGGGVGPHFDSYDVFLLQGPGRRRWRISGQRDRTLVKDAPLRILKQFKHTQEWTTECGDLLYLPPRYAHEGVAAEACITLSVGFRAPGKQALASGFLEYLQDELQMDGIYEDRGLSLQQHPAQLPPRLLQWCQRTLDQIRWGRNDIIRFAGRHLTEPKAHVVFTAPDRPLALRSFARQLGQRGARLALPSRLLFSNGDFFMNGEHCRTPGPPDATLIRLADHRAVPAVSPSAATVRLLHKWYCAGYIEIG